MAVDVYSKDEKGWRFASFSQLGDVVLFPSLGAQLALADIYEAVELGEI